MKAFFLACTALVTIAASANADVLANYSFDGSVRTSFDTNSETTASPFSDGPGFASLLDATRGNSAPSISVDTAQTDGNTNAAAVTANDYFTFTITPAGGFALNLTNLSIDYANYTNDGTFPAISFFVRSSINNFSANIGSTVNVTAASAGAFANTSFNLTGAAFQNVTTPIEFRIYVQDGIADPDRGILLDNIILNGTAVPEPSTYAMIGLGATLLVGMQRFRRRS
jgi:hypothetical protein